MKIRHLFLSPGHNYFGRHGQQAGQHPLTEVSRVECVAGSGLRGDRFFDYKPDYKGQVTFFAEEVWMDLCAHFSVIPETTSPGVFRRNVITAGVDLSTLIGREFEVQGVRFAGISECAPCHWMDSAFHPGAEAAMKGRGGLRARVLASGWLQAESLVEAHG